MNQFPINDMNQCHHQFPTITFEINFILLRLFKNCHLERFLKHFSRIVTFLKFEKNKKNVLRDPLYRINNYHAKC